MNRAAVTSESLGERPCEHNDIGIVRFEEAAARLSFDEELVDRGGPGSDGEVLDQVRELHS